MTLVTRGDKMLRSYDQEIVEKLVGITREKGIDICFNFKFPALRKQADGSLLVESGTGEDIETDLVLFAIGRVPKTKDLGLEAAGVAMDEEGAVIVDEHNRTNVPGIYAVGDVTNRVQLTPSPFVRGTPLPIPCSGAIHALSIMARFQRRCFPIRPSQGLA